MDDIRIGGLILAAGRSSRMGAFKPLLPLGESNIILSSVDKLHSLCGRIAVVVGRNSFQMREVLAPYPYVTVLYNEDFKTAPMFSSVLLGVEYLISKCERMFILPCDTPAFREHTLFVMQKHMNDTGAKAVIPTFCGRAGHPVLIDAKMIRGILNYDGRNGLAGAIKALGGASEAAVPDYGILLDADTPQDYDKLLEYHQKRKIPVHDECEAVFEFMRVPEGIRAHGRATAKRALGIADRLIAAGHAIDRRLVYAGALLHDICRSEPDHARRGAEELCKMGFETAAKAVSEHMSLTDTEKLDESALVYYADKTTADEEYVTLDERERRAQKNFNGNDNAINAALQKIDAAREVEKNIQRLLNAEI